MKSAYWMMGWRAYVDGRGYRACPFFEGEARREWIEGYSDAIHTLNKPLSAHQ